MATSMGFPIWTLWGMGLSALGALAAIALALLAQSPRMLTRLNLTGQRLDLRAKAFTGYGLALLLLAMGFFAAGVPLGPEDRAALAEAGNDTAITLLSPGAGREFTTDDTINFDWFWPNAPATDQQFAVYLSDGSQEYMLGFVDEPNNGAAYRLAMSGQELPVAGDDLTWWVRLESGDGETLATSEAMPLVVTLAGAVPGPNGSQSGAMIGLPTTTPDLSAGGVLTGTAEVAPPPDATPGEPAAPPPPEATDTPPPTDTPTPVPTATPTPTPPPTPTPTPILGPIARVAETSNLPMRIQPDGAVLVVLVRGDIVIPLSGHAFHGGQVWREISTVAGMVGWVQERYLQYENAES